MLLPEEKVYAFIAAYTNLLHYTGATYGLVPEDLSVEEFTKGGTARLIGCRRLLFEDLSLLDEFAADGALDHPDFFLPMLRAVARMRPVQARVLRDTPGHTICFDVDDEVFHHVKSLTDPLGTMAKSAYPLVEMMLMTYGGLVAHDGLVVHIAEAPELDDAQKEELEAMYVRAVAEDRVGRPWGPGAGSLGTEALSKARYMPYWTTPPCSILSWRRPSSVTRPSAPMRSPSSNWPWKPCCCCATNPTRACGNASPRAMRRSTT